MRNGARRRGDGGQPESHLRHAGYGGGMSSAKAALESDTRVLAYEAGRKWGVRVNTISAGPLGSRAAKAIGFIDDMIKCAVGKSFAGSAGNGNHATVGSTCLDKVASCYSRCGDAGSILHLLPSH